LRIDAFRLRAAASVALCAAVLALAALAGGCLRSASAPEGNTARQPEPLLAQTPQPTPAQATTTVESPLPPPKGHVSDFAEVIDAQTEEVLEAKLRQLKERAYVELAVATVETTGGRDIFEYSLAVARGWGLGPPAGEEGGGLLLLIATKDRKWRIQVSRSLEADISNDEAARIGGRMTDALREGRYGEAVAKCVDDLIQRLAERRGFPAKTVNGKPETVTR
jgi:uncharacterized membrane protein YgcG